MVQVYIIHLKEGLCSDEYETLYHWVSPRRKQKIDRLKQEKDRIRSLLAGSLFQYVLQKNEIDGEWEVRMGSRGKPFLEGAEFNISHAGPYVAMAFGQEPVGVDVEGGRAVSEKIVARFHPEEISWYEKLSPEERESRFYQIWTAKESVMKRDGRGLSMSLNEFSIFSNELKKELYSVQLDSEYWLSLCSSEAWNRQLTWVSLAELLERAE